MWGKRKWKSVKYPDLLPVVFWTFENQELGQGGEWYQSCKTEPSHHRVCCRLLWGHCLLIALLYQKKTNQVLCFLRYKSELILMHQAAGSELHYPVHMQVGMFICWTQKSFSAQRERFSRIGTACFFFSCFKGEQKGKPTRLPCWLY